MSKRGAEDQLTKDDYEAGKGEGGESESGVWKAANEEKLKQRTFVKVRRKGETTAPIASASAPSFNLSGPAANPAAEPADPPAATPAVNAFTRLLDPTEWVCEVCEVRNKKEATKCKACEAPKKGSDTKDSTTAAAPAAAPAFSFGVPSDSKPTFSFGASTPGAPTFSFGTVPAAGSGFNFSFGKDSSSSSSSTPSFTFGSKLSGEAATFGSLEGKGFSGEGKLEGSVASFGSTTADPTKEEFKNKKRESSGEEGDTRIFSVANCKVFNLKTVFENPDAETEEGKGKKSAKWVECGTGEAHINTYMHNSKKKARLVLRADKTQRLVINAPLYKEMSAKPEGEKFVRLNTTCAEGKPTSYLMKMKLKADVAATLAKVEEAIKQCD